MTYEELKIKLDLYDPEDVLMSTGCSYDFNRWFVVCDEGDCHLFKDNGEEDDIHKVTSINYHMINHDKIKKIIIPDSVTRICIETFMGCSGLTSIMIPDSITKIGSYAFLCCNRLKSVVIPKSVTSIGFSAFNKCSKLKSLVFKSKTRNDVKAMAKYSWGINDVSIIKCV